MLFGFKRRRATAPLNVSSATAGEADRAERLVKQACRLLQRWIDEGDRKGYGCQPAKKREIAYASWLGEADGAGTVLRVAAAGDEDGQFSAERLLEFKAMLERWSEDVLNSVNTQSVVLALMLTVLVPLLLRELTYGPGPAAAAAMGDADGAANPAFRDLPSFLGFADPWRARRNLYVAECALLSLAIFCCFRGLQMCLCASKPSGI